MSKSTKKVTKVKTPAQTKFFLEDKDVLGRKVSVTNDEYECEVCSSEENVIEVEDGEVYVCKKCVVGLYNTIK